MTAQTSASRPWPAQAEPAALIRKGSSNKHIETSVGFITLSVVGSGSHAYLQDWLSSLECSPPTLSTRSLACARPVLPAL